MSENLDMLWEELEKAIKNEEEAKKRGITTAKITKVESSTLGEIFSTELLEKWDRDPETPVVVIYYETEWGEKDRVVYTRSTAPNSNLRKFFVQYGRPEPGKEITLIFDKGKGRWKVAL